MNIYNEDMWLDEDMEEERRGKEGEG